MALIFWRRETLCICLENIIFILRAKWPSGEIRKTQVIIKFHEISWVTSRQILNTRWGIWQCLCCSHQRGSHWMRKSQELKYDNPISVDKRYGLSEAIRDLTHEAHTQHVHMSQRCNLSSWLLVMPSFLTSIIGTLEDVLAHDPVDTYTFPPRKFSEKV